MEVTLTQILGTIVVVLIGYFLKDMKDDIRELRKDIKEIRKDTGNIKEKMEGISIDLEYLKSKSIPIKEDIYGVNTGTKKKKE